MSTSANCRDGGRGFKCITDIHALIKEVHLEVSYHECYLCIVHNKVKEVNDEGSLKGKIRAHVDYF